MKKHHLTLLKNVLCFFPLLLLKFRPQPTFQGPPRPFVLPVLLPEVFYFLPPFVTFWFLEGFLLSFQNLVPNCFLRALRCKAVNNLMGLLVYVRVFLSADVGLLFRGELVLPDSSLLLKTMSGS